MGSYLLTGMLFGLAAGISPGPLLALVISETVRHGRQGGIRVALAPLVTDVPIILLVLFLSSSLYGHDAVIGTISVAGALFILYLAYECFFVRSAPERTVNRGAGSLRKGIISNLLNPHPYLFWLTIGCPLLARAYDGGFLPPAAFLGGLYGCLVGSKIMIAFLVGSSRGIIDRFYVPIIRILGAALVVFAILFLKEGLPRLGLW